MSKHVFSIFPNENFVDLCMYQFGREQCDPAYSFGPATRNHYLFHYVPSGTGRLMATDFKGQNHEYQIRSGQGFMIFPKQVTTYIADARLRGNTYGLSLTGCAQEKRWKPPALLRKVRYTMPRSKTSGKIWSAKCSISWIIRTKLHST